MTEERKPLEWRGYTLPPTDEEEQGWCFKSAAVYLGVSEDEHGSFGAYVEVDDNLIGGEGSGATPAEALDAGMISLMQIYEQSLARVHESFSTIMMAADFVFLSNFVTERGAIPMRIAWISRYFAMDLLTVGSRQDLFKLTPRAQKLVRRS